MIGLYILLGILGLLAVLWLLPLRRRLRYDEGGGSVCLAIGPKRLQLYPKPPKKPRKQKKKKKQAEKAAEKPEAQEESSLRERLGGKLPLFRQLLRLGTEALGRLLRHLTVTDLRLTLFVGTRDRDPAAAALRYGAGWSAVGALLPFLERHFIIKDRDIQVYLDENAHEDRILASATLHILLGELVHLALVYGIRALGIYRREKRAESHPEA